MKRIDAVLDILKGLDWKSDRETDSFVVFHPPTVLQLAYEYNLFIPKNEDYPDFDNYYNKYVLNLSYIYNITENNLNSFIENYNESIEHEKIKDIFDSLKLQYSHFKIYKSNSIMFNNIYLIITVINVEDFYTEYFAIFIDDGEILKGGLVTKFPKIYFEMTNKKPEIAGFIDALTHGKYKINNMLYNKYKDSKETHIWNEIQKDTELYEMDQRDFIFILRRRTELIHFLNKSKCEELIKYLKDISKLPEITWEEIS